MLTAKFTIRSKIIPSGDEYIFTVKTTSLGNGFTYDEMTEDEFRAYVEEHKDEMAYDFCHWDIPLEFVEIISLEFICDSDNHD